MADLRGMNGLLILHGVAIRCDACIASVVRRRRCAAVGTYSHMSADCHTVVGGSNIILILRDPRQH